MTRTPDELRAHAHGLAFTFDIRLIEAPQLKPEEACGLSHIRVALIAPIVDEITYAIALHELGHLAAPTGIVRNVCAGDRGNLMRIEEDAAWTWARHYALLWTPHMEALARWAENSYQQAGRPPAPTAPVAPLSIDWNDWK